MNRIRIIFLEKFSPTLLQNLHMIFQVEVGHWTIRVMNSDNNGILFGIN